MALRKESQKVMGSELPR